MLKLHIRSPNLDPQCVTKSKASKLRFDIENCLSITLKKVKILKILIRNQSVVRSLRFQSRERNYLKRQIFKFIENLLRREEIRKRRPKRKF